ncbi:hypothetical protein MXB_3519 [Myxobolus squamalis]|nr:hypothetical protein MXB_3519 [Myxobolus squamalis]
MKKSMAVNQQLVNFNK